MSTSTVENIGNEYHPFFPTFLQECRFGAGRTSRCRSRRGCAAAASRSHPARASDTYSGRSPLTRSAARMPGFVNYIKYLVINLATFSNSGRGGEDLVQQHPRGRGLDGRVQVPLLRQVGAVWTGYDGIKQYLLLDPIS